MKNNVKPLIEFVPYYPFNQNSTKANEASVPENNQAYSLDIIETIEKNLPNSLEGREKEVVIKARVNQSVFREGLLNKYKKCCLCSIKIPSLLIASHIKPWSVSKAHEKLDTENGFLFCPTHDKLFDTNLITFDNNGKIIISDILSRDDILSLNINENMTIVLTERNKKYLVDHRKHLKSNTHI